MSTTSASTPRKERTEAILRAFHDEQGVAQKTDFRLISRLFPYMKLHWKLLSLALVLLPLSAVATLTQPLLIKRAIDAAVVRRDSNELLVVTELLLGLIVVEFITRFVQVYTMQLAGQRTVADLRRVVFSHAQSLRMAYFDRTPVGRVVTRVTNDIDALGELFASGAVTAIADIGMLIGIVVFMLIIDWRLSLIAFAALPPLAIVIEVLRRKMRETFRAIRALTSQLNATLSEQVQGIAVVQAFGREVASAAEYGVVNEAYRRANHRSIRYDALLYSIVEGIAATCVALVLYYAGVHAGLLEQSVESAAYIGTVVAMYEYIQRFFIPIRDLSTKYTIIQQSLAAAERIFGLLDLQEPDAPASTDIAPRKSSDGPLVEFEHVRFHYRESDPVLRDISFTVQRGETIAIVGATGAGKTTVTALLLRLYERTGGAIYFEGRDVRDYACDELRKRFAVVPQDVFLFSGTVLENVAVGDAVPDVARAKLALDRVGASEVLRSRDADPLNARIEERGANFSLGERQLIAFARALYRNPDVLVLDEATANVDSATEAQLQHAVEEVLRERTAIVIAHRLSTIRRANRILVFHKGELVEQGTHEALLAKDGVYARLHSLQFAEAATR